LKIISSLEAEMDYQCVYTSHEFTTLTNWSRVCWTFGTAFNREQLIAQWRVESSTFWAVTVTLC